jgi:hypothetical protein
MQPVVHDRIRPGRAGREQQQDQQQPADRVARPPGRQQHPTPVAGSATAEVISQSATGPPGPLWCVIAEPTSPTTQGVARHRLTTWPIPRTT